MSSPINTSTIGLLSRKITSIKQRHTKAYINHKSSSLTISLATLRMRLDLIHTFKLNIHTSHMLACHPMARKILKHASKISVENTFKKMTHRFKSSIYRCKTFCVNPNEIYFKRGIKSLSKFASRTSSGCIKKLSLNTIHPSTQNANLSPILNYIGSNRKLKILKLNMNLSLNETNLQSFSRNFGLLSKLTNLSFTTLSPLKTSIEDSEKNPKLNIGSILSSSTNLRRVYFKCLVTRPSSDETSEFFEKFSRIKTLEKLELTLHCPNPISSKFFSKLSNSIASIKTIKSYNLIMDTTSTQTFESASFEAIKNMTQLIVFSVRANKLRVNTSILQTLFNSIGHLSNLKDLNISFGGNPVNFSSEYYSSLSEALAKVTNLNSLSYKVRNLASQHFDTLFLELPTFKLLNSLSLKIIVKENDVQKMHTLNRFLQSQHELKRLSIGINDTESESYSYDVPSSVIDLLAFGLESCKKLEKLKLSLGSIEDVAIESLEDLLSKFTMLELFGLDAVFSNISQNIFGDFCSYLKRCSSRVKQFRVHPRLYSHANSKLLKAITN